MNSLLVTALLWTAALGSGLMAGVYFAFSAFVMRALGSISGSSAIATMNSINSVILRSSFMPLFIGSTIVAAMLMGVGVWYWSEAGAGLVLIAGLIYFSGMFVSTIVCNVPLNNELAGVHGEDDASLEVWSRYLKTWTNWNHSRTACSLATCAMCIWALSS